MKKTSITLFLVFIGICILYSQEVISTAGQTESNSGYEVSWTIGEPAIKTLLVGNTILTQGFHQSKLIITAIDEMIPTTNTILVFPNPTNEFAIVKFSQIPDNHSYNLFDLTGKCLNSGILNSTETQVNLDKYAEGSYILKILQNNGQPLQSFKIIKQ